MEAFGRSIPAVALLAIVVSVSACSSDGSDTLAPQSTGSGRKPIVLKPEAVRAPRAVSDDASVEEGRIVLPASAESVAWAGSLAPGNVIAGNRDTRSISLGESKNPYGFLRKVLSVSTSADPVVIMTEQAFLTDLIEEGDLVFGEGEASLFPDTLVVRTTGTRTLHPLDTEGAASGSGAGEAAIGGELTESNTKTAITPIVRLTNGRFAVQAKFTGELKLRSTFKIPTGVEKATVRLDLDPVATVDIEWGASVGHVRPDGTAILDKTWRGPTVPIPLPGPIPLTLRLQPEVGCTVSVGGEITARSRVFMHGHAAAGFDYAGGSDLAPIYEEPLLESGHDFIGIQGKASLRGECAISGVVSVLAFDAIGIEGKVGPYAAIEGAVCGAVGDQGTTGDFAVFEEHGLRGDLNGRLQVPGLAVPSVIAPLFSLSALKKGPNYLLGDGLTCAPRSADSCAGKPNGIYCSELAENSAYECEGNQIKAGQQCAQGQKCKGPNGSGTTIQCQ